MRSRFVDAIRQDLRYAFRRLVKAPGFTVVTVFTLAVGIGATTTIFSAVDALLLNPIGVRDPSRVVAIRVSYETPDLDNITISPADFVDVRDSRDVFAAAAMAIGGGVSYTAGPRPERLYRQQVTWQWFDVFGAAPHLGRTFTADDDRPDANRIAILEYRAWERLFGSDPSIVGETIRLDYVPYQVVGVMGPAFRRPNLNLPTPHLWTPLGLPEAAYGPWTRFNESFQAFAQVQSGVSVEQARAFMGVLTQRVRDGEEGEYARTAGWSLSAIPFVEFIVGDQRTRLMMLLGSSVLVLFIACFNAAGLSLARESRQIRNLALRSALGASRQRLTREAFTESLLVAAGGVVVGVGMAMAAVQVIRQLAPSQVGDRLMIPVDATMVAFTVSAGVASAVLVGLLPAWRAGTRAHLAARDVDSAMTSDRGQLSMRSSLVTLEIALTMVLLVGAGLFLRSLAQLQEVDTGFQARGVMTGTVELPRARFGDVGTRADFYRAGQERLAGLPGVAGAAVALPIPFSGGEIAGSFTIEGRLPGPSEPQPHGGLGLVSPDYFSALGIPVRSGRVFDDRDVLGAEPVALVDERLAGQYWPEDDPIGKRIRRTTSGAEWARIVGVVGRVVHTDLAAGSSLGVYYYPIYQQPPPLASLVVKSPAVTPTAAAVREALHAVDPARPVFDLRTMEARVSASLGARRFALLLLAFFATTALFLAALGVYGVVGYRVGQRTREIGIRMALGAQPGAVLRMIMRGTVVLAGSGLALGAGGSFLLTRSVAAMLYDVVPTDPLSYGAACACLLGAALAAGYLPARRAARMDPLLALRHD